MSILTMYVTCVYLTSSFCSRLKPLAPVWVCACSAAVLPPSSAPTVHSVLLGKSQSATCTVICMLRQNTQGKAIDAWSPACRISTLHVLQAGSAHCMTAFASLADFASWSSQQSGCAVQQTRFDCHGRTCMPQTTQCPIIHDTLSGSSAVSAISSQVAHDIVPSLFLMNQ